MTQSGRLTYLTFVSVALGQFAGIALALVVTQAGPSADDFPGWLGFLLALLPPAAAAAAWAVVNRWETGHKWWGALAVFLGSLAALILLLQWGLVGLVAAMVAAGGFGVAARRLLDQPHEML
jgi:hypothetical protein